MSYVGLPRIVRLLTFYRDDGNHVSGRRRRGALTLIEFDRVLVRVEANQSREYSLLGLSQDLVRELDISVLVRSCMARPILQEFLPQLLVVPGCELAESSELFGGKLPLKACEQGRGISRFTAFLPVVCRVHLTPHLNLASLSQALDGISEGG
jgi:hypothetical protein